MSDNRTTELREKLNKLIVELDRLDIALDSPASDMTLGEYEQEREKLLDGFMQAIAATLGSDELPYDALLRCLENDWHISASWDGLRKFWCIELTEEGMRMRDAERHAYEQRITGDGSDWGETMRDAYHDLMASAGESCTPKQMRKLVEHIRAELGSCMLTAEQVRECVKTVYLEGYSDGSVSRGTHLNETDWQAIADELNAELGSGTCHGNGYENDGDFRCSECGFMVHTDKLFNYCPKCRRKVVNQ